MKGKGIARVFVVIFYLLGVVFLLFFCSVFGREKRNDFGHQEIVNPRFEDFSSTRYECIGYCTCTESKEIRRGSTPLRRISSFSVFALSSILAMKTAKNSMRDFCLDVFSEKECSFEHTISGVEKCESINDFTPDKDELILEKAKKLKEATFSVRPIGIIRSPWKARSDMPNYGSAPKKKDESSLKGTGAVIEIFEDYREGIKDLEGISHIHVFFMFDKVEDTKLLVHPFGLKEEKKRGVFSTRAPNRPNSIGETLVKVLKVEELSIYVSRIDAFDGTPVVDIKPFFPQSTVWSDEGVSKGWFGEYWERVEKEKN